MESNTNQGNLYYGNYKAQVLAHKPHGIVKLFVPGVTPISFIDSITSEELQMSNYNILKNTLTKNSITKSSYLNVDILNDSMTEDDRILYIESLPDAYPALSLFGGTGAYNHTYSYPHIGSWVWCFFENGQHTKPVYFASIPGGEYAKHEYNEILEFNDDPNDKPIKIENKEKEENSDFKLSEEGRKLLSYNNFNHRRHSFVSGKNKVTIEEDGRLLIEVGYVPDDGEQNYNLYTSPYGNNSEYLPTKKQVQENKTRIEICQSNISIKVPKTKAIEKVEDKENVIDNTLNLKQDITTINSEIKADTNYNRTYNLSKNIDQDFKFAFNTREQIATIYDTPLRNLAEVDTPESKTDNEAYYEAVINIDCEQKINIKCPQINIFSENINAYNSDNINLVNSKNITLDNGDTINVHNGKTINIKNKTGDINVDNEAGDIKVNSGNNINITVAGATTLNSSTIDFIGSSGDIKVNGVSLVNHVHPESHGKTGIPDKS
jgi:hypothetical protein